MRLGKHISQIAEGCGFASASRLGREFRRAYGSRRALIVGVGRPARARRHS
ncbi:hypothetical protein [Burkholderia ambifaria]|nr:hypothetical protein [Burkholderia ambifaria]